MADWMWFVTGMGCFYIIVCRLLLRGMNIWKLSLLLALCGAGVARGDLVVNIAAEVGSAMLTAPSHAPSAGTGQRFGFVESTAQNWHYSDTTLFSQAPCRLELPQWETIKVTCIQFGTYFVGRFQTGLMDVSHVTSTDAGTYGVPAGTYSDQDPYYPQVVDWLVVIDDSAGLAVRSVVVTNLSSSHAYVLHGNVGDSLESLWWSDWSGVLGNTLGPGGASFGSSGGLLVSSVSHGTVHDGLVPIQFNSYLSILYQSPVNETSASSQPTTSPSSQPATMPATERSTWVEDARDMLLKPGSVNSVARRWFESVPGRSDVWGADSEWHVVQRRGADLCGRCGYSIRRVRRWAA